MANIQNVRLPQTTMDALKRQVEQEFTGGKGSRPGISRSICEVMRSVVENPNLIVTAVAHRVASQAEKQPKAPTKQTSITADEHTVAQFKELAERLDYSFDTLLKLVIEDRILH